MFKVKQSPSYLGFNQSKRTWKSSGSVIYLVEGTTLPSVSRRSSLSSNGFILCLPRELDFQAGFSLEIYFQTVNDRIGRHETPSLHTAVEMLSGKPG